MKKHFTVYEVLDKLKDSINNYDLNSYDAVAQALFNEEEYAGNAYSAEGYLAEIGTFQALRIIQRAEMNYELEGTDFGMADSVANSLYYLLGMKIYHEVMDKAHLNGSDNPNNKENQEAFLAAEKDIRRNYREYQTAVDVLD